MERACRIFRPTFRAVLLSQRGSSEPFLLNQEVQRNKESVNTASFSTEERPEESRGGLSSSVIAQLKSAQKHEEILTLVQSHDLNCNQASLALSALKNCNIFSNSGNLSTDERFLSLLGKIEGNLKYLSSESLVNSLINIFKLQQQDSPTVQLLEAECRQRLRGMAVRHLGLFVCHSNLLSSYAGSASLSLEALRVLQLRWKEMTNPFLLKRLLRTSLSLSPSFLERLEDKTLELIDSFSFQDLVDIADCFTASKRRSLLVMRAISYQAEEQKGQWEVSQLLNLVNNMRLSKFYNYLFLKDVAAFCKQHLAEYSPKQVSEIVKCFGLLRMPEQELFDALTDYLKNHLSEFTLSELQVIVFGLSIVNLKPPTQLVKRLVFEFESLRFSEQVEVCLALAVFNATPTEQVRKMFQSKKVDDIMGSNKPRHMSMKLKLLQLNAHVKLECQDYQGPFLPEDVTKYPKTDEALTSSLHRDVTTKLVTVLGDEKFLLKGVALDSGYFIDAEIAIDGDGKPFSAIDYNTSSNTRDHSLLLKDLPEGTSRVAVIVNGPASYLYDSSELTGRRRIMVRHLQALKCHVIQVPFQDWSSLKTESKKVEYLKDKLSDILKT